jgi:hypothetical protein
MGYERKINYNGQPCTLEVQWAGSSYVVRIVGIGTWQTIPNDCIHDIEKIKPYIIMAMEKGCDLAAIKAWDGNLNMQMNIF